MDDFSLFTTITVFALFAMAWVDVWTTKRALRYNPNAVEGNPVMVWLMRRTSKWVMIRMLGIVPLAILVAASSEWYLDLFGLAIVGLFGLVAWRNWKAANAIDNME